PGTHSDESRSSWTLNVVSREFPRIESLENSLLSVYTPPYPCKVETSWFISKSKIGKTGMESWERTCDGKVRQNADSTPLGSGQTVRLTSPEMGRRNGQNETEISKSA